jgi:hypothetical protein
VYYYEEGELEYFSEFAWFSALTITAAILNAFMLFYVCPMRKSSMFTLQAEG